jgi:hypothetical protein
MKTSIEHVDDIQTAYVHLITLLTTSIRHIILALAILPPPFPFPFSLADVGSRPNKELLPAYFSVLANRNKCSGHGTRPLFGSAKKFISIFFSCAIPRASSRSDRADHCHSVSLSESKSSVVDRCLRVDADSSVFEASVGRENG